MPFKDPDQCKIYNRGYARDYAQQRVENKLSGICSVGTCNNKTDGQHKKCAHHLQYMRDYKTGYRTQPKPEGECSKSDCRNKTDGEHQLCLSCRQKIQKNSLRPEVHGKRRTWENSFKPLVHAAYGGKCRCCGETCTEFLTVDHVDGYKDGPRGGWPLYFWLKEQGFPQEGFRLLCWTCNYTLGHHGYCPHGNLTQATHTGRPRIHPVVDMEKEAQRKEQRRQYWLGYKLEVMNAYGGARCICCGEAHIECLQIDHTDQRGAAHRREHGYGANLYTWLRQQGFPPGFRVLCPNCNVAFFKLGFCPHTIPQPV